MAHLFLQVKKCTWLLFLPHLRVLASGEFVIYHNSWCWREFGKRRELLLRTETWGFVLLLLFTSDMVEATDGCVAWPGPPSTGSFGVVVLRRGSTHALVVLWQVCRTTAGRVRGTGPLLTLQGPGQGHSGPPVHSLPLLPPPLAPSSTTRAWCARWRRHIHSVPNPSALYHTCKQPPQPPSHLRAHRRSGVVHPLEDGLGKDPGRPCG